MTRLVIALAVIVLGIAGLAWHRHAPNGEAAPNRVLMSRDDFARLCEVGKDYVDCVKAVGEPDRTQKVASSEYWYWIRRTRDPRTGKADVQVQVVIESGWVRSVNFY